MRRGDVVPAEGSALKRRMKAGVQAAVWQKLNELVERLSASRGRHEAIEQHPEQDDQAQVEQQERRHAADERYTVRDGINVARFAIKLKSLATHTVFGIGLYVCALGVSYVLLGRA